MISEKCLGCTAEFVYVGDSSNISDACNAASIEISRKYSCSFEVDVSYVSINIRRIGGYGPVPAAHNVTIRLLTHAYVEYMREFLELAMGRLGPPPTNEIVLTKFVYH